MIFYQLVCCGLLVQLAAALPMNGVAQPSPAVRCQQLSPVPRPKGEAVLVCDVSGIRRDDMMFYCWFYKKPDNTRMPVYIYSGRVDVDEITSTNRDMFVNETHDISDDHLKSQIRLRIKSTSNYVILFELTTKKHVSIADQVEIVFEDPQIKIDLDEILTTFAEESNSTIHLEVTCYVDVCFGKPIMSIICNNIEDADALVLHEESQLDHQATYFSGKIRIVMIHRNCLQVSCSVTDERGTYQATRNITHNEQHNPELPRLPQNVILLNDLANRNLIVLSVGTSGLVVLLIFELKWRLPTRICSKNTTRYPCDELQDSPHLEISPSLNTTRSPCDELQDIPLLQIAPSLNTTRSPCDEPQDTPVLEISPSLNTTGSRCDIPDDVLLTEGLTNDIVHTVFVHT